MTLARGLNAALAFGLELVMLLALGFWGFTVAPPGAAAWALGLGLPLTQSVAIPAVLLTARSRATMVPAVFSAIVGGHFLPYAWLYQTPVYAILAVGVALIPFLVALRWEDRSVTAIPVIVGLGLLVAAAFVVSSYYKASTTDDIG